MKTYVIEKREDFVFGPKVETLPSTFNSTTDCFDRIDQEIDYDKMRWSNCTDKTRHYEINKTSDRVELRVHKSGVRSNVVSTITYKIIEVKED
jgi:hypothetical protein